jgi:hypothetical protein
VRLRPAAGAPPPAPAQHAPVAPAPAPVAVSLARPRIRTAREVDDAFSMPEPETPEHSQRSSSGAGALPGALGHAAARMRAATDMAGRSDPAAGVFQTEAQRKAWASGAAPLPSVPHARSDRGRVGARAASRGAARGSCAVRAEGGGRGRPPLVLIGHTASLTPY